MLQVLVFVLGAAVSLFGLFMLWLAYAVDTDQSPWSYVMIALGIALAASVFLVGFATKPRSDHL